MTGPTGQPGGLDALYRAARRRARGRSTWRLRRNADRWGRAAAAGHGGPDGASAARLAAVQAELRTRALGERGPWGLP